MIDRIRQGPGRPPKYGRAARAVTITLPKDVLVRLASVDADLGRAIVRLAERHGTPRARTVRAAEIAAYGNRAVIVVNPATSLKRLPGVQLVPIGVGRALISLEPDHSVSQLELDVRDALDRPGVRRLERETLEAISGILRQARRSRRVEAQPRTIIVLETTRDSRRNGRPTAAARKRSRT
jgi:hypothetical protein